MLVGTKKKWSCSFICECESKSYSILEIKFYSPPYYVGHVIPEHLNENWNVLVFNHNTKCIHSWIALMDYVCRKRLPLHIEIDILSDKGYY